MEEASTWMKTVGKPSFGEVSEISSNGLVGVWMLECNHTADKKQKEGVRCVTFPSPDKTEFGRTHNDSNGATFSAPIEG